MKSRRGVASGKIKSEKLTEDCLAKIAELNPKLNAFITVTADEALQQARQADKDIAGGRRIGPLHGIPISLKDLIDQKGVPTTAGSLVRKDHVADADAVVTQRLRDAGAVFVGKTNLHEFAFGTTSEDSGFGLIRNPHDPSRSPGGSSGGSAVAVATGMSLGTHRHRYRRIDSHPRRRVRHRRPQARVGTDLRIRRGAAQPSARSRRPARRIGRRRVAALQRAAEGHPSRSAMRSTPRRSRACASGGCPATCSIGSTPTSSTACAKPIALLQQKGATVVDVALPHADDMAAIYLHLVFGDAAEYHARTLVSRPQDYTTPVRLRLEMARYVLAEDYIRALRGKALITREVDRALDGVDALVLPSLAIPAPPIGAATMPVKGGSDAVRTLMLRCTQPFNLSGHPAISIPCGRTRDGLPIGLQLVGPQGPHAGARAGRARSGGGDRFVIRDYFHRWEQELAAVSKNERLVRPFEWGEDWIDQEPGAGSGIRNSPGRRSLIPDPDLAVGRRDHARHRRVLHAGTGALHLHEGAGHRARQRRRRRR